MRKRGTIGRRRFSLSTRRLRRILSWKFVFYDLLMPALRGLGPRVAMRSWDSWANWRWYCDLSASDDFANR